MNTAIINVRVDAEVKKEAQAMAKEFGVSLSSIVQAILKQIIKTKKFTLSVDGKSSAYLHKIIKESKKVK